MTKWGDKALVCKKCGKDFVFLASERQEYAAKGWYYEPSRCPDCRGRNGATVSGTPPDKITCASCESEIAVGNGQPAYCKSCLQHDVNQLEAEKARLGARLANLESQLRAAQNEVAERQRALAASEAMVRKHGAHVQALEKELRLAQETNLAHQDTTQRLELRIENLELRARLEAMEEMKAFAERFEQHLKRLELDLQKGQHRAFERVIQIEQQLEQLRNRGVLGTLFSRQRQWREASDSQLG